ncbi:MAG: UPF0280 family protein, partial [Desulfatiglandales bacterium]
MRRFYRDWVNLPHLQRFEVKIKETDLLVMADRPLEKETVDLVLHARQQIEAYIEQNPQFLTSLSPLPMDPFAPPLIRVMLEAGLNFGVGPMASVAGAIAQFVGEGLRLYSGEVIVENGGDVYASTKGPLKVGLLPWPDKKDLEIRIELRQTLMPVSVCSSSSRIGHSLSFGSADLACIVSPSGAMADAAATSAGNRLRK